MWDSNICKKVGRDKTRKEWRSGNFFFIRTDFSHNSDTKQKNEFLERNSAFLVMTHEDQEKAMVSMVGYSLANWDLKPIASSLNRNDETATAVVDKSSGRLHEYSFATSIVHGVPHPPFIRQEVVDAQQSQLVFRETDLFVVTFSKCGTTLMEQIVLLLLNNGKGEDLNPLHKNTLDIASGRVGKVWTEMAVIDGLKGLKNDIVDDAKACMGEGKARMTVQDFDALPPPRVLKSHAPTNLFLDKENKARIIYVTRNPFDACVSCYYHVSNRQLIAVIIFYVGNSC